MRLILRLLPMIILLTAIASAKEFKITASANTTKLCIDEKLVLMISFPGEIPKDSIEYSWSGPMGLKASTRYFEFFPISGEATGWYYATVRSGSLTAKDSIYIKVWDSPIEFSPIEAMSICRNDTSFHNIVVKNIIDDTVEIQSIMNLNSRIPLKFPSGRIKIAPGDSIVIVAELNPKKYYWNYTEFLQFDIENKYPCSRTITFSKAIYAASESFYLRSDISNLEPFKDNIINLSIKADYLIKEKSAPFSFELKYPKKYFEVDKTYNSNFTYTDSSIIIKIPEMYLDQTIELGNIKVFVKDYSVYDQNFKLVNINDPCKVVYEYLFFRTVDIKLDYNTYVCEESDVEIKASTTLKDTAGIKYAWKKYHSDIIVSTDAALRLDSVMVGESYIVEITFPNGEKTIRQAHFYVIRNNLRFVDISTPQVGTPCIGEKFVKRVEIYPEDEIDYTFSNIKMLHDNLYIISDIEFPVTLPPDNFLNFELHASKDIPGMYRDTIVIEVTQVCPKVYKFPLEVIFLEKSDFEFYLKRSIYPTGRDIEIPIYIQSKDELYLDMFIDYEVDIKYDTLLFEPSPEYNPENGIFHIEYSSLLSDDETLAGIIKGKIKKEGLVKFQIQKLKHNLACSKGYFSASEIIGEPVSVPENSQAGELILHSLPAKDELNISFLNQIKGNCDLKIYSSAGDIIYKENFVSYNGMMKKINLSGAPSGVYYLHVHNVGKSYFKKFILIR